MRVRALGAGAVAVGVWAVLSSSVSASPIDPCDLDPADWCLERSDDGQPADDGSGEPIGTGGQSDEVDVPPCVWEPVPGPNEMEPTPIHVRLSNGEPPDGVEVAWQGWCYSEHVGSGPFPGPFRWVPIDDPGPSPGEVAGDLYDAVRGRMPDPVVVTSPPAGVDAVVGVPVFVSVSNWQDELVEERALGPGSVTVTAAPELVVDPGVPGHEAVVCDGPGIAYDPEGGDLWDQAVRSGACAYPYERRSGVEGRPEEWVMSVTVRWSISWSASSGEGGTFPDVERSVAVPRGVVEVQALVIED